MDQLGRRRRRRRGKWKQKANRSRGGRRGRGGQQELLTRKWHPQKLANS
jgi:hypothetical protein